MSARDPALQKKWSVPPRATENLVLVGSMSMPQTRSFSVRGGPDVGNVERVTGSSLPTKEIDQPFFSRFMPHFGHFPGPGCWTSGCIGHV